MSDDLYTPPPGASLAEQLYCAGYSGARRAGAPPNFGLSWSDLVSQAADGDPACRIEAGVWGAVDNAARILALQFATWALDPKLTMRAIVKDDGRTLAVGSYSPRQAAVWAIRHTAPWLEPLAQPDLIADGATISQTGVYSVAIKIMDMELTTKIYVLATVEQEHAAIRCICPSIDRHTCAGLRYPGPSAPSYDDDDDDEHEEEPCVCSCHDDVDGEE